ncbi:MAG: hypothetical protein FWK04_14975 [Nostoc sp. GBBB01]|nr:hypothetical protein [Nostoc sp. GBBB01]
MKKLHLGSMRSTISSALSFAMTFGMVVNTPIYAQTLTSQSTPLDHLKAAPRPVFKKGNTLLPLTQAHCGLSRDTYIELANYWGYGLPIDKADLTKVALANPGRYQPVVMVGGLYKFYDNYDGRNSNLPKLPPNTWIRDNNGKIILEGGRAKVSPAAPNETFEIIGNYYGQELGQLEKYAGQPIKLILNEGESGLWIASQLWEELGRQDPTVNADFNNSGLNDWFAYISRNKARQERVLKEALFKRLQSRPVYSWYQEQYGTERGRWNGWPWYMFLYEHFLDSSRKPIVSDYTAPEMYYNFHNSGWSGIQPDHLVPWDALTQALNNISGAISLGQKFTYPWTSIGWEGQPISSSDRFMGMMKTYYTAGAIGSVSMYPVCSGPLWEALYYNKPIGATTPTLIRQLTIQGHTHALFSHLEEYLRKGDLLRGPNLHPYQISTKILPAMEFPAEGQTTQVQGNWGGPVTIPTARVVARKIQGEDRWLVTAWANVGSDRDVKVKIDNKLGTLTLRARKAGSVYVVKLVNGLVQQTLIDSDAMNPTKFLSP